MKLAMDMYDEKMKMLEYTGVSLIGRNTVRRKQMEEMHCYILK